MSDRLQQEHATVRKWQQRKRQRQRNQKRKKRRHPRGSRENDIGEETERTTSERKPRREEATTT
ncbi:hypothetical protein V1522DRAFT_416159 [Lipomyces starkeyi]